MAGSSGELPPPDPRNDLPEGARSPAASETSQFTSISERPVNPRWRPPRHPLPQRSTALLDNNPDFDIQPAMARRAPSVKGRAPIPQESSRYPMF